MTNYVLATKKGSTRNTRHQLPTPMLPPQDWEHVFRYLTPTDSLSVINTCHEWSELLHLNKFTILLPLVLPIVMQYVSTKDILGLRGMTKHFKTTTDAILQQYAREPSKEIDREPHPPCHRDESAVSSKIGDLEIRQYIYDFDNFLNQWGSGLNGNGFMTGTLRLSFFRSMFPNTLDNVAISTLLTHQGPNIYKMKYLTDLEAHGITMLFLLLEGNLPNLKALKVSREVKQGCSTLFRYTPTRTLRKLECLNLKEFTIARTEAVEDAVLPYLMFLRAYGRQLKVFHIGSQFFDFPSIDVPFLNKYLKNLGSLVVNVNQNALEKLSAVNWKHLHQLRLSNYDGIDFAQLLSVINHFSSDLAFLRVEWNYEAGVLEHVAMRELPKLRKFTTFLSEKMRPGFGNF